jgi:hypothetical protein
MFTRPNAPIHFEQGEPICHVFPIERGRLEAIEPVMARLSDAPELEKRYEVWRDSRHSFNDGLRVSDSAAVQQRWQKTYFRGQQPDGGASGAEGHRSKLHLKAFPELEK